MSLNSVLITGSTGFLGNFLLNYFKNNNIDVHELYKPNGFNSMRLNKEVPNFKFKFDLVIHAAGKAHVISRNKIEESQFFDVNVNGTINLLTGLENSYLPKFFTFISTVAVYGLQQGNQINENTPLLATDPYGLSKIQAERLIQDWCKKYGVICTILRLPLIAGPNPPGNLGAMIKGIQRGYYFNIDQGKERKSIVLAEDVAKSILNVAEVGGIYNLTDGYHPDFNELSNLIAKQLDKAKVFNMPIVLAKIAAKMGDLVGKNAPFNTDKLNKITSTLTFDDSKAKTVFGWNPTPVLEGFKIN